MLGESVEEDQITQILARLPTAGSDDYVTKVLEIYQHVAKVYRAMEPPQALLMSPPPSINGFAASTNV